MFSCDYNGWADVPEDEREAMQAFESASQPTRPLALNVNPLFSGSFGEWPPRTDARLC